jgi:hypothetical protein
MVLSINHLRLWGFNLEFMLRKKPAVIMGGELDPRQ